MLPIYGFPMHVFFVTMHHTSYKSVVGRRFWVALMSQKTNGSHGPADPKKVELNCWGIGLKGKECHGGGPVSKGVSARSIIHLHGLYTVAHHSWVVHLEMNIYLVFKNKVHQLKI